MPNLVGSPDSGGLRPSKVVGKLSEGKRNKGLCRSGGALGPYWGDEIRTPGRDCHLGWGRCRVEPLVGENAVSESKISVQVNGRSEELPAGMTVEELLQRLDLAGRPLAVEINGEVIPREVHGQRVIMSGDRIEIVTLVGGG